MQIQINELTLAKMFELSQFIKEECNDLSTLEETAQELMKTLYQIDLTLVPDTFDIVHVTLLVMVLLLSIMQFILPPIKVATDIPPTTS